MFLNLLTFSCAVVACLATETAPAAAPPGRPQPPAPPAAPSQPQVYCGEAPANVFLCMGSIEVIPKEKVKKCSGGLSECDKMKCIFRESGWALPGDKVNKQKMQEYFTQYAVDHPEWASAVRHLKVACLGDKDLPAQGTTLNCAPYDVVHCIQTSFLRNVAPGQWKGSADCAQARSYAASCPFCPSSCFAPQVPYGSCNACLTLPRTP